MVEDPESHENGQDRVFKTLRTGQKSVPTGTAEPLTTEDIPVPVGAYVKVNNEKASSGVIYIGGDGITTDTGYEIDSGQDVELRVSNVNQIYVIASSTGYDASWLVLTEPEV